ncbi:MAG: aldo/keto reductase [Candidatus Zipacnadales bacterium]
MRTRTLGRTKLQITEIVFGGIPILQQSPENAAAVLRAALDEGINCFDTARGYGDSEEKMGAVLANEDCLIMSKSGKLDAQGMTAELETTLRNLRRDHVDVYAMHQVFTSEQLARVLGPNGSLEALLKAKDQGKVRAIGITGHNRGVLVAAIEQAGEVIESCMFLFNPLETDALNRLVPLCVERGVGLIAMKVPGGGIFSWEQALASAKWCLSHPITCVNVGFATVEEVRAMAAIGQNAPELTAGEVEAIRQLCQEFAPKYCRRCGSCMPCPQGINITNVLVGASMVRRIGWQQLSGRNFLDSARKANDCDGCGLCVERCPWSLDIPTLLPKALREIEELA